MGAPVVVAHLIGSNFYGGPEKQIVEHALRLDRARYTPLVASFLDTPGENAILARAAALGLAHAGIPMKSPLDIRAQLGLMRLLRQRKVGLLCLHGYKSVVMGHWAAKLMRIPTLAFSRGYTAENRKIAFYEWLERRVVGRQSGLVCVSEGQRRKLAAFGIAPPRAWVVHNAVSVEAAREAARGADPAALRRQWGVPEGAALVFAAGRLSPEKGQRFLVEAVARMERAGDAVFVFLGDGPSLEELKIQARTLGVGERFRFAGFRPDLPSLYPAMDLLALPSLTEGLPNVVLEAFSFGKPVVATAVGGVPEIVRDEVNGLLVPSGDPGALARALDRVLADRAWAASLGARGLETVEREFSFDAQNAQLTGIYDVILGEG